jgi:hypothetical protein
MIKQKKTGLMISFFSQAVAILFFSAMDRLFFENLTDINEIRLTAVTNSTSFRVDNAINEIHVKKPGKRHACPAIFTSNL